jgi:diphosphoinositol-polyphosphate diphosphatase
MTISTTSGPIPTDSRSVTNNKSSKPSPSNRSRSMHPSLPMSARTGRSKARYASGTNRRLCAGMVALSTHSTPDSPGHYTHVLVTSSSRKPEKFVLPKGGWEQDESAEDAALREGWEEGTSIPTPPNFFFRKAYMAAGVVGKVTRFLGQVIDPRPPNKVSVHDKARKHNANGIISDESTNGEIYKPRSEYLFFEVEVEDLTPEYPESGERTRKWVCVLSSPREMTHCW